MKRNLVETGIGIFVICIAIAFSFLVIKVSDKKFNPETYKLSAVFDNVEGVGIGTKVKIGGVEIGSVKSQKLTNDYRIKVVLDIDKNVKIPNDSTITITTSGILGGKYLKVQVGGSDELLQNNEEFEYTQSSMDLEDILSRFLLNKSN